MSDTVSDQELEQDKGLSFQAKFSKSQKAKIQPESPTKTKKRKTKVELTQESLIHKANMRRNLFKKPDFIEGEGTINGNTMKMFQMIIDMIWDNHDKITANSMKIESNLRNIQIEFKNFRQQLELDREEMVRDKLNEVHQQWAVNQNNKLAALEKKAFEISNQGSVKHQKVIDGLKQIMADNHERLEKKQTDCNNLLKRAQNIMKQAILMSSSRHVQQSPSRGGAITPITVGEMSIAPQRKVTSMSFEHFDLAGQFREIENKFQEQLTLAKIELREEISATTASINEAANQSRRSPALKQSRKSAPQKAQTVVLQPQTSPKNVDVSVKEEIRAYVEDIYHKSLDQIAKLRKDMQLKFKSNENKTALLIDQKIQDMPVIMNKKTTKETRPPNQNMNTLYANEVNIGMGGDSLDKEQLQDYVKAEVNLLIGETVKDQSHKIAAFKNHVNRKMMSLDSAVKELQQKQSEIKSQTLNSSQLEVRKTASVVKKRPQRGISARGVSPKRVMSAIRTQEDEELKSPGKSPKKLEVKLPAMSPNRERLGGHAFGSALTVPKTTPKKKQIRKALEQGDSSTLEQTFVTAAQMDNRIAARLQDTENVLADLQRQFQKASVRLELKNITTKDRERRHHSSQHSSLEDHEARIIDLESRFEVVETRQQDIMHKIDEHTRQIDEDMLQKEQQKMFSKMNILQNRFQVPMGVIDHDEYLTQEPEERIKHTELLENQLKVLEKLFRVFLAGKITLKLFNEQIRNFEANAIGLQATMFKKYDNLEINEKLFAMQRFVNTAFINSKHNSGMVGLVIQNMVKASETAKGFHLLSEAFLHVMVLLYNRQNIRVANDYEIMSKLGTMLQNTVQYKTLQVDKRGHPIEEDKNKIDPAKKHQMIVDIIQSLEISMQRTIDIEGPQGLNVDSLELLGFILDVIEDQQTTYSFDTIKAGLSVISVIIPMAFENIKSKRNAKVIALIKHVDLEKLKFKLGHIMTYFEDNAEVQSLVRNALQPIEKLNAHRGRESLIIPGLSESDRSGLSTGQVSYRSHR